MSIRFECPACRQPIEVDDEWANQRVGCPYCQQIVTAPAESTFELGRVPRAAGTPGGAEHEGAPRPPAPPPGVPEPGGETRREVRRPLGRYGMLASLAGLILTILWAYLAGQIVMKYVDPAAFEHQDAATQQRLLQEAVQQHRDEFKSLAIYPLLGCISGLFGVSAGVISLFRNDPGKGYSIFAVILGMLATPCNCLGTLFFAGGA